MNKWTPHDNFHVSIHMQKQIIFAHVINPAQSSCTHHVAKTVSRRFVAAVKAAGPAAAVGAFAGNKGLPGISQIW